MTHITTGIYKGQKIELGVSDFLRPTKNQVLQAGISMLGSRVNFAGVRVLDICCGSGQWGIEAISRGASHVDFVDLDCSVVRRNLAKLEIPSDKFSIYEGGLRGFVPSEGADVVIADPPYGDGLVEIILRNSSWGKAGSLWILEIEKRMDVDFEGFEVLKISKFGLSKLVLMAKV